jgi:hypothetical protein
MKMKGMRRGSQTEIKKFYGGGIDSESQCHEVGGE